ncbi:MAG: PASTA domain-containing protein [Synergistaceae bacterium]|nr:PASTA domain-containing protein [Synergistaceae bacterium]
MKKRQGGIISLIVLLVVVTIFASGAIAVYTIFLKPDNKSKVPQFVGNTTVAAVAEAENLGLVVQLEPVASTLPEGRVLAQTPQAGEELRKGQVIVLQVSQGGELHSVPNVQGQTLAKAQEEIKSQGFTLGDVIKISEPNVKPGTVIAQSPAAPAEVTSGRKIDLLVQAGTAQAENITVPDVNRMTEEEARNVLETAGVKVQAVDRVYSPLLPEGLAIETRPSAGTLMKPGQGVILKLATQRRPAGYSDVDSKKQTAQTSKGNGTVTAPRNTAATTPEQKGQTQTTPAQTQTANNNRGVTVSVGGEDEVFIGDDYDLGTPTTKTASKPATPTSNSNSTSTQQKSSTSTPAPAPATNTQQSQKAESTPAASTSGGGNKTAKIRYPVPPLARPMDLRIEITDPNGTRTVLNRQVRSNEVINTTAKYSQECVISYYLGGEFVWQERQK